MTPRPAHRASRPGFTLVELIVVVVILAVMAGLAVPRLLSTGERRALAEVDAVASLITQAARRQMLTTTRVALQYDADPRTLRVVSLKPGDAAVFDGRDRAWAEDALLPRVALDTLEVSGAQSSTTALDPRRFHAELADDGGRVAFAIVLRDPAGGNEWTVRLPLTADRALVVPGRDLADVLLDPDTVDLDDAGRRDSPW